MVLNVPKTMILDKHLKNYILLELEKYFNKYSTSLSEYNLPLADISLLCNINNRLLLKELNYKTHELKINHNRMISTLNLYNKVLSSVYNNDGQLIFVYSHGGIG